MAEVSFVLEEELARWQDDELEIAQEVLLDTQSNEEQSLVVNRVVDALANDPAAVRDSEIFGALESCVKYHAVLSTKAVHRLLDGIASAMQAVITPDSHEDRADIELVERYAFLLQWWIRSLEKQKGNAAGSTRTKQTESWSWPASIPTVLHTFGHTLHALSDHLWKSSAERDTLVSRCIVQPVCQFLEDETYMKSAAIKKPLFQVMSLAAKLHGQALSVQTSIMQSLQYYEHCAEPMADLLAYMRTEYDMERLAEDILRELANKTFTSLDSKSPRSFGRFLVRMAEINPRSVLKQISLLQTHLDSESYPIRIAMIEVQGLLIKHLSINEEFISMQPDGVTDPDRDMDDEHANVNPHQKQIDLFFTRIQDRFLDVTTFVRTKAIQTCVSLCDLPVKYAPQRLRITTLAARALEDKGSNVRRNAIALLVKLILTHPFGVLHGGELTKDMWLERRAIVEEQLQSAEAKLTFPEKQVEISDGPNGSQVVDASEEHDSMQQSKSRTTSARKPRKSQLDIEALNASQQATTHEDQAKLMQLRLTLRYYDEALLFIEKIEQAIPILVQLLASTFKAEVLESMDFFRIAHEYQIRGAEQGVRAMVHLIWAKDNALVMEDGSQIKGVRSRLMEVYRALYFDPYPELSRAENVARVARNMIQLTFNATLAELTSLEQLFSLMYSEQIVSQDVIQKLWEVYASPKKIAKAQRQGAILILGMLATVDRQLVADQVETLLSIGLGSLGMHDITLAKYTALALQRVSGSAKKVKGALSDANVRYPMAHPMFARLRAILQLPPQDASQQDAWFGLAEHAIQAIYALGEQPDALCTELIQQMTRTALQAPNSPASACDSNYHLAQLLFIVGHVALKQIVYMELVERELKRRKAESDQVNGATKKNSELEQVAGNAEDDVGDMLAFIKERELLFGPQSLLALYGPLVAHILQNASNYSDEFVQRAAALTLPKLMCVSSDFCEAHLPLLLRLVKAAPDPIVRANAVIGLGDVAICFGTLIDENSDRLYAGLNDENLNVKKNTLMVLTHLILNGMIKVKGQLGEMAKCLEDREPRISDLAKLFFSELATKENAVYNNLPDIISHLSSGQQAVDEEVFANTMRFIFTFIDKERQAENVIEKLCQRFRLSPEERQWRDIAYCLSLLPYRSERSIKKLVEGLPFYQDKLYQPEVYKRFTEILAKMRQGKASANAKTTDADLREFEEILNQAASQGLEDHAAANAASSQMARTERRRAQRPPPRRKAQRA
ncbi:condensin complex non-SMC subunit Cnd1 [Malassezia psittaci]|uniref:Condensin complex subunit 1 n=1 Tax=Malassezia psittaci TaxID=1821823 RepID=A0AAF0FCG7_9BASI|nr:condensin complex non-SMC subunit Cnd1 [Malassezia psittaci]